MKSHSFLLFSISFDIFTRLFKEYSNLFSTWFSNSFITYAINGKKNVAEILVKNTSFWIGTSSRNPNFAHAMWNQHDASQMLIPRSTNVAEGWHRGFNSMMSCSNPTLWKFIDCLRAEQALTDARHTKRFLRERPEPRAPKWVRYDQHLQRIVDAYDDYSDKMDYLKAIGNRTMVI